MMLLKGLAVGLVATQALDWVSEVIYEKEKESARIREDEARGGLHAYEAAADRVSRRLGVPLNKKDLQAWGTRIHKALGLFGGLSYVALRSRSEKVGSGLGLNFGAAFFLGVDEVLVPLLKLTPGPGAFSWKVHGRGAAAHLAYGVAAELIYRLWDELQGRITQRTGRSTQANEVTDQTQVAA